MTLPDTDIPRKPRRRRGLYIPFLLLVILAAGWSGGWFWVRGEALRRLDLAKEGLGAGGVTVSWTSRTLTGFPFRLDADFTDLRVREPSGWALAFPRLKAEAYAYSLDHWVFVAPEGVTFVRPVGGPVTVRAKALRASISSVNDHPPKVAIEGLDLTFEPAPGAQPYFVSGAKRLQFNLRPGPDDQGQVYLQLADARARLSGLFARIAGGKPVTVEADAIFSRASALNGRDWPSAVNSWRGAQGEMKVRSLKVAAGDAVLAAQSGVLTVGSDGRLRGSLSATLRQAPRALAAMGQEGAIAPEAAYSAAAVATARSEGDIASMTIDFQAGQTTLGPVAIGPAPRVY